MTEVFFYVDARGRQPVRDWMEALSVKTQQKIAAWIHLLEAEGHQLRRPYADKVRGALYELRIRFGADQIRILYFFFMRDKIILLHVFRKKQDRIEARDIELAEARMADVISRGWSEKTVF